MTQHEELEKRARLAKLVEEQGAFTPEELDVELSKRYELDRLRDQQNIALIVLDSPGDQRL
jgi:hypothetical protein